MKAWSLNHASNPWVLYNSELLVTAESPNYFREKEKRKQIAHAKLSSQWKESYVYNNFWFMTYDDAILS